MVAITKAAGAFATTRRHHNTTSLLDLPRTWFTRHDLRQKLAAMDAHLLRAIRWTGDDAKRQPPKPFWTA